MGLEITGKTLGIIGLGKVGSTVARRLAAFDMEVLANDPFRAQRADGVTFTDLDDLLRRADIVTLHVPLTALTRNLIGARELALMKPGALLINVARGQVVDEAALAEACRTHLGGAAIDTFAAEPLGASGLLDLPNVILTPHLGGTTQELMRASAVEVAEEVTAVLDGRGPEYPEPRSADARALAGARGQAAQRVARLPVGRARLRLDPHAHRGRG